jgi:hypothetical protein
MLQRVNRLPVDLAEFASFLDQPRRGPVRAFFDRSTGEIEPMPRDAEVEGVFDDIVTAPQRWLEIQPLPVATRGELRRRFLEGVGDVFVRLRLAESLTAKNPFSRFDAVLRDVPGLLDRWVAFRAGALAEVAQVWLSALGVEAVDKPR